MIRPLIVGGLLCALAQDVGAPRFRTAAEAVRVDVLVQKDKHPIAGLTAADFELKDSGIAQQVEVVSMDDVPVSVMLGLDTSTSVAGSRLEHLKDAARALTEAIGPDEHVALMTFASTVNVAAGWTEPPAGMRAALARLSAGGMTTLYDAIFAALTTRDPAPGRRHLLVFFSDGRDTASWLPRSAVIETARRTDAVIYAVARGEARPDASVQYRSGVELWPGQRRLTANAPPVMTELAELTGGRALTASSGDRLRDLFTQILREFRSRYVLTYRPRAVEGLGWHPIEVKVKGRKLSVTHRRGYTR